MKRFYHKTICVLSIGILLFACSDSARLKEALGKYVEKENKTYPMKVDDYTQLQSCKYIEPATLRYVYTTVLPSEAITDSTMVKDVLKQNILGQSKIEANSQYFREKGVIFQYEYRNADGYLFRIDITPEDYKKK